MQQQQPQQLSPTIPSAGSLNVSINAQPPSPNDKFSPRDPSLGVSATDGLPRFAARSMTPIETVTSSATTPRSGSALGGTPGNLSLPAPVAGPAGYNRDGSFFNLSKNQYTPKSTSPIGSPNASTNRYDARVALAVAMHRFRTVTGGSNRPSGVKEFAQQLDHSDREDVMRKCVELFAILEDLSSATHDLQGTSPRTMVAKAPPAPPTGAKPPNRTISNLSRKVAEDGTVNIFASVTSVNSGPASRWGSVDSAAHAIAPVERMGATYGTDGIGNDMINDYTIVEELGRGAHGKVDLAIDESTGNTVAIKTMNKGTRLRAGADEDAASREIAIMKQLRHKNIVPLLEVIDDEEESVVHLVMEYVPHGPVVSQKQDGAWTCLCEERVRHITRQMATGLQYLHNHGIVHSDIKPDNVLLGADDRVFLVDFGVSEIVDIKTDSPTDSPNKEQTKPQKSSRGEGAAGGTIYFMSPEKLTGAEDESGGIKGDVWALGVVMYIMLFGKMPFQGANRTEVTNAIVNGALSFPDSATMVIREVLGALLEKDPHKRMTLRKFRRHPFTTAMGTDPLADESLNMSVNPDLRRVSTTPVKPNNGERRRETASMPSDGEQIPQLRVTSSMTSSSSSGGDTRNHSLKSPTDPASPGMAFRGPSTRAELRRRSQAVAISEDALKTAVVRRRTIRYGSLITSQLASPVGRNAPGELPAEPVSLDPPASAHAQTARAGRFAERIRAETNTARASRWSASVSQDEANRDDEELDMIDRLPGVTLEDATPPPAPPLTTEKGELTAMKPLRVAVRTLADE